MSAKAAGMTSIRFGPAGYAVSPSTEWQNSRPSPAGRAATSLPPPPPPPAVSHSNHGQPDYVAFIPRACTHARRGQIHRFGCKNWKREGSRSVARVRDETRIKRGAGVDGRRARVRINGKRGRKIRSQFHPPFVRALLSTGVEIKGRFCMPTKSTTPAVLASAKGGTSQLARN